MGITQQCQMGRSFHDRCKSVDCDCFCHPLIDVRGERKRAAAWFDLIALGALVGTLIGIVLCEVLK